MAVRSGRLIFVRLHSSFLKKLLYTYHNIYHGHSPKVSSREAPCACAWLHSLPPNPHPRPEAVHLSKPKLCAH